MQILKLYSCTADQLLSSFSLPLSHHHYKSDCFNIMVSDHTDYRCVKRGRLAQLDSRLSEVQTNHEQIGCNFTFSKAYEQQIYVTAVLFHMWS